MILEKYVPASIQKIKMIADCFLKFSPISDTWVDKDCHYEEFGMDQIQILFNYLNCLLKMTLG